jgi:hypothetical protein
MMNIKAGRHDIRITRGASVDRIYTIMDLDLRSATLVINWRDGLGSELPSFTVSDAEERTATETKILLHMSASDTMSLKENQSYYYDVSVVQGDSSQPLFYGNIIVERFGK